MSNYATKSDLESAIDINTSKFAKEVDLACLKPDIEDLDVDKLKEVPVDLCKLSNVGEKEATIYDKLVTKVMLFRLLVLVI